jgi:hypothetical protein
MLNPDFTILLEAEMAADKVSDAIVRRVESEIGPRLFAEAISLLANEEASTWSIADRFGLSLYTVRLLRDRPFLCLRYILDQQKEKHHGSTHHVVLGRVLYLRSYNRNVEL